MNDNELDEMMDQWKAPQASDGLRRNVRNACAAAQPPKKRWFRSIMPVAGRGLFAGVAVGAAMCLLLITQAFPQTPPAGNAYLVQYEWTRYGDNGAKTSDAQIKAFNYNGHEFVIGMSDPENSLHSMLFHIHGAIFMMAVHLAPSLMLAERSPEREAWVKSKVSTGCAGDTVVGHETVAGHPSTIVQSSEGRHRTTAWLAPDMGCYTLKVMNEDQLADGSYRLRSLKRPVSVTLDR